MLAIGKVFNLTLSYKIPFIIVLLDLVLIVILFGFTGQSPANRGKNNVR